MINQLSPVVAVVLITIGQSYAFFFKSPWVLFLAMALGTVAALIPLITKSSSEVHWLLVRLKEVVRYLILWPTFPILGILLLSSGGYYAIGTLFAIPLMIYLDRRLRTPQP